MAGIWKSLAVEMRPLISRSSGVLNEAELVTHHQTDWNSVTHITDFSRIFRHCCLQWNCVPHHRFQWNNMSLLPGFGETMLHTADVSENNMSHSDSERGNLLPSLHGLLFIYAPSHRQDSTYHCLCYTTRGALAGMRNSSWRIDPMTHRTMSEHSYHGAPLVVWVKTMCHTLQDSVEQYVTRYRIQWNNVSHITGFSGTICHMLQDSVEQCVTRYMIQWNNMSHVTGFSGTICHTLQDSVEQYVTRYRIQWNNVSHITGFSGTMCHTLQDSVEQCVTRYRIQWNNVSHITGFSGTMSG